MDKIYKQIEILVLNTKIENNEQSSNSNILSNFINTGASDSSNSCSIKIKSNIDILSKTNENITSEKEKKDTKNLKVLTNKASKIKKEKKNNSNIFNSKYFHNTSKNSKTKWYDKYEKYKTHNVQYKLEKDKILNCFSIDDKIFK